MCVYTSCHSKCASSKNHEARPFHSQNPSEPLSGQWLSFWITQSPNWDFVFEARKWGVGIERRLRLTQKLRLPWHSLPTLTHPEGHQGEDKQGWPIAVSSMMLPLQRTACSLILLVTSYLYPNEVHSVHLDAVRKGWGLHVRSWGLIAGPVRSPKHCWIWNPSTIAKKINNRGQNV